MWRLLAITLGFMGTVLAATLEAQTIVLDSTQTGLRPGAHLGTVRCPPWIVSWYQGMATATNESSKFVDTLFVSSVDCGIEVDTIAGGNVDTSFYYCSESYRTLSIVGPYISYEYGYEGSGGAHPVYGGYYRTIELGSKRTVSLDRIFPEMDILHALVRDQFIRAHLVNKRPMHLSELEFRMDYQESRIDFDSLLVSYAFYDVVSDSVEVDFGLMEEIASSRGGATSIDINLRIPPKSRQMFDLARENRTLKRAMR